MIFFKSIWRIAIILVYTILIIANTLTKALKFIVPYGNKNIPKRIKPYVPNFNKSAANSTEPIVGASTCASGSQICKGNVGILAANAKKKNNQSQY
jgi:hypothetical protein